MTPLIISVLIIFLAMAWIVIDDLIWGRSRRFKILTMLANGPMLGRDLTRGRSASYVLLNKMQDEGIIMASDLGWGDESYRYHITNLGHTWLRKYGTGIRRSGRN